MSWVDKEFDRKTSPDIAMLPRSTSMSFAWSKAAEYRKEIPR